MEGATLGSPPWRRINSAISFARRLSKEMTLSPCRPDRELDSMDSRIIAGKCEALNSPAQMLHDHTGSDRVVGRIVDHDETPGGAVAHVTIDDQRLLYFDTTRAMSFIWSRDIPSTRSRVFTSTRY